MVLGITGKSGSGKSTLGRNIEYVFGIHHLDLDKIIYSIIENEFHIETVKLFGEAFNKDGTLINRQVIGDKIFSDRDGLYKEYTKSIYSSLCAFVSAEVCKYENLSIDHILLTHMKEIRRFCDTLVLVEADPSVRRERVLYRDCITEEYFDLRESASIEYDKKEFDFVITDKLGKIELFSYLRHFLE